MNTIGGQLHWICISHMYSVLLFYLNLNRSTSLQESALKCDEGPLKCEGCDALIIINDLEGKDIIF